MTFDFFVQFVNNVPDVHGCSPLQTTPLAGESSSGRTYKARQGDTPSGIAQQAGLTLKELWDHPNNQKLKEKRANPNILFAGDKVFIPEPQLKSAHCATEKRHEFKLSNAACRIRLQLLEYGRPRSDEAYEIDLGNGRIIRGKTDAQGYVKATVPADIPKAQLRVETDFGIEQYPIQVGHLDPIQEITGVQQRLDNLGFHLKVTGQLDEQTKAALSSFQSSYDLEAGGEPDQTTLDKLVQVHGS